MSCLHLHTIYQPIKKLPYLCLLKGGGRVLLLWISTAMNKSVILLGIDLQPEVT